MRTLVSNASADGSDAEVQGRNASVGGPLGCLYSERTGPVDGALCTFQILPYAAANIWRLDREWAIVGGMTTGLILLCCACCIYCTCRCRSPYDDDKYGNGDAHPPRPARTRGTRGTRDMRDQSDDEDGDNSEIGSPLGRIQPHRGSSAVCFAIRDSAASANGANAPPPPPAPPVASLPPLHEALPAAPMFNSMPLPPPPPMLGGPAGAASSSMHWTEHVDPSTGGKYYEDEHGNTTWDAPPAHKIIH